MINEIYQRIKTSSNILLLTHKNPDGDALGSVSALADFIFVIKKQCQIFITGEIPQQFKFLPHFSLIKNTFNKNFDLIIACDYSDFKRTNFAEEVNEDVIITFDHHLPNENQRGILKMINPQYSSTCELLYYFFKNAEINISKNMAVSLLSGILTDTGFFKNPNVSPSTLKAVKDLTMRGASIQQILNFINNFDKNISNLKFWSEALRLTQFDFKNNIIYTCIPYEIFKQYNQAFKEISGFASFINTAANAIISLTLTEQEPNVIRGSLRTKVNSNIDVAEVAEQLSGGGHQLAAGFEIQENFDKIIDKIVNIIRNHHK